MAIAISASPSCAPASTRYRNKAKKTVFSCGAGTACLTGSSGLQYHRRGRHICKCQRRAGGDQASTGDSGIMEHQFRYLRSRQRLHMAPLFKRSGVYGSSSAAQWNRRSFDRVQWIRHVVGLQLNTSSNPGNGVCRIHFDRFNWVALFAGDSALTRGNTCSQPINTVTDDYCIMDSAYGESQVLQFDHWEHHPNASIATAPVNASSPIASVRSVSVVDSIERCRNGAHGGRHRERSA